MAIEKIALENIKDIVENDTIETCAHLDPTTAVAYEDSVKAAEHVAKVEDQLKKEAEVIATDAPEESKVKEDKMSLFYCNIKFSLNFHQYYIHNLHKYT